MKFDVFKFVEQLYFSLISVCRCEFIAKNFVTSSKTENGIGR